MTITVISWIGLALSASAVWFFLAYDPLWDRKFLFSIPLALVLGMLCLAGLLR